MTKPHVYATRRIPESGLDALRAECELTVWQDDLPVPRDVLLENIAQADGLLCLLSDKIDAEVIAAAPNLKVISNYAVGYDNIDIAAATERGIPVGNTPGVLTETTADLAFALLLAAARRVVQGEKYVQAGKWKTWGPTLLLGQDIYGKTIGIVGLGRIGQAVARRAKGFGMRVLYYGGSDEATAQAIGAEKASLEDLLRESDFVSLHVPYMPQTHHLIDADALALMKPTAILVNTARGAVVDQHALYEALRDKRIDSAGLDVTDPEPISMDDPLLELDNVVIIPHLGSASYETRGKMALMTAENLLAGLADKPLPNCVNPEVYG